MEENFDQIIDALLASAQTLEESTTGKACHRVDMA